MKIVDEIVKLIKSDIEEAFDILDEVFSDTNSIYNDLNKEYASRPNNFDMETFRSKLKRFVKINSKHIINYHASLAVDSSNIYELSNDLIYEILCKLNFKKQVEYFDLICECDKSLIPFVVRAKGDRFGQKWLCTRLINCYEANSHEPIVVDMKTTRQNLQQLVEYLIEEILRLGMEGDLQNWKDRYSEYKPKEKIERAKQKLTTVLYDKAKTATQFIIIKNAFNHINSDVDAFFDFHQLLINLNRVIDETDHKCILIFVEETPQPYMCGEHYLCTHEKDIRQAEDIVNQSEGMKIIGLQEIKELSESDIDEWYKNLKKHKEIREKLRTKSYSQLSSRGNPEHVIRDICSELDIEFRKEWMKY